MDFCPLNFIYSNSFNMFKNSVLAICVCVFSFDAAAQSIGLMPILQEIEQNNASLKAFSSLIESERLVLKTENNLPDPQAGAFYLPFGDHSTGDYSEFQITQSFEFPTVYGARSNLIETQVSQNVLRYKLKRQEILHPAVQLLHQLVFLDKKRSVVVERTLQAKTVYTQLQKLYELEQIGILEVNKGKIAWVQEQFKIDQLDADKKNILLQLQSLNGGKEIQFDPSVFVESLKIAPQDSIWANKKYTDPELLLLNQRQEVARQQIKLSKNQTLPNLTAGYNYQGVAGSNYSGIYAGVSIPLWSGRNTVKAAEAQYQYHVSNSNATQNLAFSEFSKQYNQYQILLIKYTEYRQTLSGLESDALLKEAYELGEFSFMEYYVELQFYQKALDSMLEMENQLHLLKSDLLKHQL